MYRTRISAQLIFASCLVVILTIALIEVTAFLIVIWFSEPDEDLISENLGAQAQLAASALSELPAASSLAVEAVPATDREALDREINRIVQTGVPLEPAEPPASLGESPRAAIISERGEIIASTLPAWAGPTRHYTGIDFAPAQTVVARAIELRGDDTDHGNSYVLDYSGDSMASAHPIMIDGEFAGLVLFQADGVVDAHPVPITFYLLRIVGGNVILFGVLTVPVIAAAVPISIFRARRISRRLERLSDAATAMARGDLSQRVDIAGEDEVAQVGQRFNEMVAQLEQADRSRKAFVSNISHELRTPVAILQGNLEQLIARHQLSHDDVPDARTLEAMHQETVTLARLIDDLFTLARIEEAVLEFEPAPVNLAACIRRAVDGIASLAWNQQRVSVESLVADGVPPILAEETRVQQILSNLLYNALRHTPEGGVIVVNAQLEGGQVAVTIADTGLGIPPEDLPHVFDRYRQVERAGRHHDGSGLGLAIVKQLVEAMGGAITVESMPNQGTTFSFTLPIARQG